MKNAKFIAAITAALVGGFVLGGLGIATAGSSAPHTPGIASAPGVAMALPATWMHASQRTTAVPAPVAPKQKAAAKPVKRAAHKASTAKTSDAAHRTATRSRSVATHRCSTTCPTHHPSTSESHDGTSGANHGGCND